MQQLILVEPKSKGVYETQSYQSPRLFTPQQLVVTPQQIDINAILQPLISIMMLVIVLSLVISMFDKIKL